MSKVISIILSIISLILSLFQVQTNKAFKVEFINYDSTIISTCELSSGETAIPPAQPQKTGATFLGWKGNYINVQKDEKVNAIFNDEKNVFMISSARGEIGDIVTMLVYLDGIVNLCGFDMCIVYDESLELVSYDCNLDMDVVVNPRFDTNKIALNYSSAKNKNKNADIMSIKFKINETSKNAMGVKIEMNNNVMVNANAVVDAEYSAIDGIVWVR